MARYQRYPDTVINQINCRYWPILYTITRWNRSFRRPPSWIGCSNRSLNESIGHLCWEIFIPIFLKYQVIIPIIIAIVAVFGDWPCKWINDSSNLKMAPFIATFGMMTIVYGINSLYITQEPNRGQPIGGIHEGLTFLSSMKIFGEISLLVVIAIIVTIIAWFVLNKTVFGKNIYIVGGNKDAAKVSGINVDKIIISAFVIESVLVGLAGILEVARTGGANSAYGFSYEFDAISACVVGGVSLSGGIGKMSGVVIGVIIFTIISYGLAFIGINPNWQLIIKGLIICSAVALDMRKHSYE